MPFTDSIKLVDVVLADRELITATPLDVVSGKVYVGSTAQLETGILPVAEYNNDITLLAGEEHEVPFGKIPQAYTVTAKALSDQTSGTATAANILKNKTAWVNGQKVTGSMPNIGKQEAELIAGESVTISKGYHNGTGVISVRVLSDQTPGDAIAANILNGKIAWVNGSSITGTMPNIGKENASLNCGAVHTISKGYHDGTGKITANSLASQTSATATAADIVSNKTAWVNGTQITGTISKISATTEILPVNGTYVIPKGYHSGNGKVTQNIETIGEQTVASSFNPQVIQTTGKYMTGNIIVTGINALNYKRANTAVTDSEGNEVSNMSLTVANSEATIHLNVDNWHDNATMNVYHFIFTNLIDYLNNPIDIDTIITIDWGNSNTQDYIYHFGNITIKAFLEEGTNSHSFTISGISSGIISIIELFASRQFGDSHDVDEP